MTDALHSKAPLGSLGAFCSFTLYDPLPDTFEFHPLAGWTEQGHTRVVVDGVVTDLGEPLYCVHPERNVWIDRDGHEVVGGTFVALTRAKWLAMDTLANLPGYGPVLGAR